MESRPLPRLRPLSAQAYCLRLREDGKWTIVDNSNPSILGPDPANNPPRPDVAMLGPMEAMAAQAREREAFVCARIREHGEDPDDHVTTFVAVTAAEASTMTGLPLPSSLRRKRTVATP